MSTAQPEEIERYTRVGSRPAVSTLAECRKDLTSVEHLPDMHNQTQEVNHRCLFMPVQLSHVIQSQFREWNMLDCIWSQYQRGAASFTRIKDDYVSVNSRTLRARESVWAVRNPGSHPSVVPLQASPSTGHPNDWNEMLPLLSTLFFCGVFNKFLDRSRNEPCSSAREICRSSVSCFSAASWRWAIGAAPVTKRLRDLLRVVLPLFHTDPIE